MGAPGPGLSLGHPSQPPPPARQLRVDRGVGWGGRSGGGGSQQSSFSSQPPKAGSPLGGGSVRQAPALGSMPVLWSKGGALVMALDLRKACHGDPNGPQMAAKSFAKLLCFGW